MKLLLALLLVLFMGSKAQAGQLDQLLAPVAHYPDPLLSQLLMASTYPEEVAEAARWTRANPQLQGEDAVRSVQAMDWDASVKALVAYPQILQWMDQQRDWTRAVGEAFVLQERQVMEAVQALRNPQAAYVPYYEPVYLPVNHYFFSIHNHHVQPTATVTRPTALTPGGFRGPKPHGPQMLPHRPAPAPARPIERRR
jgi:hypothetical protein